MKLTANSNKEELTLDLYLGDELIERLDPVEAREFFNHLREEEAKNGHLFKSSKDWKQITITDINEETEFDQITGIDIEITALYRCFPEAHVDFKIHVDNGEDFFDKDLVDNFGQESLYSESLSNHQLRACLSDEILDVIMDVPNFKLRINEKSVDIYKFFDTENTYEYKTEMSSDT